MSSPRSAPVRHPRAAGAPTAPASPAELARLGRFERRLRGRLADGERAAWDVGELFDRIARASLHHAAGYPTLEAYADARFPEHGYATLRRYRRIALAFSRATAARHSVTKLELGLRYIELTPAHERPVEIPRLIVEVPGVGRVPFARVTTRQLEGAIRGLGGEPEADERGPRLPRGASARLRALEIRIRRGAAWEISRPRLSTRVVRDRRGLAHALVTIHDVPVEGLRRMAAALRDVR